MGELSLATALSQWSGFLSIGKRDRTKDYHREIVALILRDWPDVNMPVDAITPEQVIEFVQKVERFSVSRFNAIVTALRATVPVARKLKRRRVRLKDRVLLTEEQFARLLAELDRAYRGHGGLLIRFLAHTGLRINEARQLKWLDVHEKFLLLPGEITKNGEPRAVPLINGVRDTLEKLRAVTGQGERVLPQAECKTALNSACARAGVPRLSHHDFRHLFTTRCVQSGVDIPTVARWLGHLDGGALLARTYFHLADEHSLLMAQKVRL